MQLIDERRDQFGNNRMSVCLETPPKYVSLLTLPCKEGFTFKPTLQ